ncbi:hypothetical protein ACQKMD_03075 [Viridibacillus sp. NPDC096237]|uniref:hypothetical protein n=1 Tax=Viridibacillus sp. NPDC096237 TaxID=3390721 RepID=UPI003CFE5C91
MWIKPVAVILLGSLLLVGCNTNKANEPLRNETPMERVEDNVRHGVENVTPDVHEERVNETVPGKHGVVEEKVIDENVTTDEEIVEDRKINR